MIGLCNRDSIDKYRGTRFVGFKTVKVLLCPFNALFDRRRFEYVGKFNSFTAFQKFSTFNG
jgi:hypothetical protein